MIAKNDSIFLAALSIWWDWFFFLFAFSKGGVLKQGREEKKKREEYLNKLRLCWLAAFTLYNGALFAHFEYCNAHLSVKPFLWKIALTFKKKGDDDSRQSNFTLCHYAWAFFLLLLNKIWTMSAHWIVILKIIKS